MPGFHFYSSNRQEALLEHLADLFQKNPLQDPLQSEHIVVQHSRMQRWVSLGLANHNLIEANTRYLFPNDLLRLGLESIFPDYQPAEVVQKEHLSWILLEGLQRQKDHPLLEPIAHYLQGGSPLKNWQLAKQIASLFDQYQIYLPDLLAAWEAEGSSDWQALLWKSMPKGIRQAQLLRKIFLTQKRTLVDSFLWQRISIFGVSSLPPLHVEILEALAHFVEIHYFAFLPTEPKELLQDSTKQNPILKAFGAYGKNFLHLLENSNLLPHEVLATPHPFTPQSDSHSNQEALPVTEQAHHALPSGDSLLEQIQREIGTPHRNLPQKDLPFKNDGSLQIHACHSPMREVEVLRDQLLFLLEEHPSLQPDEILVMSPHLESYVPFIQSVFSESIGGEALPFSIADRQASSKSTLILYLLQLLRLEKSRFGVVEVLGFLESEAIQKRFGLKEIDRPLIQKWVERAHICWGVNGTFRQQHEMPPLHQNTWEFGIERLLTGYALRGEERILFEGILPMDDIEGNNALVLGNFLNFFEKLTALVEEASPDSLNQERSLKDWAAYLRNLLTDFFAQEEDWAEEWAILWQVGEELEAIQEHLKPDSCFNIEVLRHYLEEKLDRDFSEKGFFKQGITFASMRSMRRIPFQVIALLGMNEKVFPRIKKPVSFDLTLQNPQVGLPTAKEEDRYLFLELLLSCRKVFYLSYLGQDIRSNVQLPPSPVVTEILAYLEPAAGEGIIQHRLQGFHPDYFQGKETLLSYSSDNFQAAQVFLKAPRQTRPLFEAKLPAPEEEFFSVTLEQLVQFFSAPAQFLLQHRLGVSLGRLEGLPLEEEPFVLNALQEYLMESQLLDWRLQQDDLEELWQIIQARGDFPLGPFGRRLWKKLDQNSEDFFQTVEPFLENPLEPWRYDLCLEQVHLKGEMTGLFEAGLIHYRPAAVKTKDRLRIWLAQLVLNLQKPKDYPRNAILLGKHNSNKKNETSIYECEAIKNPQAHLAGLLKLYQQGLTEPLPFFPKTAEAYLTPPKNSEEKYCEEKALEIWHGTHFSGGEMEQNRYFKRCFEHLNLFTETGFHPMAKAILDPIFQHQKPR